MDKKMDMVTAIHPQKLYVGVRKLEECTKIWKNNDKIEQINLKL